jgi:hypothetical protein
MTPRSPDAPRRPAWPIGATVFTLALAAAFVGYAADVTQKARGVTDWMMILPAAAIGTIALLVSLIEDWRAALSGPAAEPDPAEARQAGGAVTFMAALALYVAAVPYAGFEIATFAFLATALLLQGERRLVVVVGFALIASAALVVLFAVLLGVRIPTALL